MAVETRAGRRDGPDLSPDRAAGQWGKLGGVTSLRYYGELLDPELANLHIFTAGLSPRFARRTTLDLVFHNCRQDVPSRKEFWTDLRARPTGVDRDVGWETDLILEWRRFSTWDLEVVAAYFRPGSAFSRTEVALVARLKLSYPF